MDPTGNPKKINRQVLKAVAHYTKKNNVTKFSNIFEFVRNCNRKRQPVPGMKNSISMALHNLEKCGLVIKEPRKGYKLCSIELLSKKNFNNDKRNSRSSNQRKSQSLKRNKNNGRTSYLTSRNNDESSDSYPPSDMNPENVIRMHRGNKKLTKFETKPKVNEGVKRIQIKSKKLNKTRKNMKMKLKRVKGTTRARRRVRFLNMNRGGYYVGSDESDDSLIHGTRSNDTIASSLQEMDFNDSISKSSNVSNESEEKNEANTENSESGSEKSQQQESEDVKEENKEEKPKNNEERENKTVNPSELLKWKDEDFCNIS